MDNKPDNIVTQENFTNLMQPRYKVIADYPCAIHKVGDIIKTYETAMSYAVKIETDFDYTSEKICMADYPAIFKKLEWWEERKVEDMPRYVKRTGKFKNGEVLKVASPEQNGRIWHVDGEIEFRFIANSSFLPATEQDFLEYQKQATK